LAADTASVAMLPAAPGRFSTTMAPPNPSSSAFANTRAIASVPPPAA
jgi:hypothetical protein